MTDTLVKAADYAAWLAKMKLRILDRMESDFSNTCWRNRTFGAMGIEK